MAKYVDDKFYDIADSWKDTISGSNCLIAKNEHDWDIVKERNPVWYESISSAGGKKIVLFPLEFKGELLGYIWAINFSDNTADTIKETLELTSFILASELYSYRSVERLHILSSQDMLTGVMNRNEMNAYVDKLAADRRHISTGVVFADLNGMKVVNDTKGHAAGDRLLRNAAAALQRIFDRQEIFRAGGDEFVVIITDISKNELELKAEQLRKISVEYENLVFAIGTAFVEYVADIRTALHLADERMYKDKKQYYQLHPKAKHGSATS
jgi:diguanylate cyclase (GGDEF)-like protein